MDIQKVFFLGIFLGVFFPTLSFSQEWCATRLLDSPPPEYYQAIQRQTLSSRSQQMKMIGITVFVVEEIVGGSNFDVLALYDELNVVNQFFAPAGIEFFFCGSPRFVQGKSSYTINELDSQLNDRFHVPNTINIYYVDDIGDNQLSTGICGISAFPFLTGPPNSYIGMVKSCGPGGKTLAHELGHFFGLLHTHETAWGVEFVNGSNCASAGDRLCDTPADPNLYLGPLDGCSYVGTRLDPNGDLYRPDPSNIMSYSLDMCQRKLSEDQLALMNFWAGEDNFKDMYSDCNFFPDFDLSSSQQSLNIVSGQTLDLDISIAYEGVDETRSVDLFFNLFDLQDPDAIPVTIQKEIVSIAAGDGLFQQTFQVKIPLSRATGTYTLTAVLDPVSKILERDNRNNSHIMDLSIDNSVFDDILLYPNPATDEVRIFLRDRFLRREAQIRVVDYLGRVYVEETRFKNSDEFITSLDVSSLQPGLYLVEVWFTQQDEKEVFRVLKQ